MLTAIRRTRPTLLAAASLALIASTLILLLPTLARAQDAGEPIRGMNMNIAGFPEAAEAGSQVSFDLTYVGPMMFSGDASVDINGVMISAEREVAGSGAVEVGEFGTVLVDIARTDRNTWTVSLDLPAAPPDVVASASALTSQMDPFAPDRSLFFLEFSFWMGMGFQADYQAHVEAVRLEVFAGVSGPPMTTPPTRPTQPTVAAPPGFSSLQLPEGYVLNLAAATFPATVTLWQIVDNVWTFAKPAIEKGQMLLADAATWLQNTAQSAVNLLLQPAPAGGTTTRPADPADVPVVSTRGHFTDPVFAEPALTSGHTATDYSSTYETAEGEWPEELVIYVHGFENSVADAQENFNTARQALRSNGYLHPVVGFSWDSDTGVGDFDDAAAIATMNGAKLAQFISDIQMKHSTTKIRIIGHSLGTRVILNALRVLDASEKWKEMDAKVRSVHVVGAAVDNEDVDSNNFGPDIERQTAEFHNLFSTEDDVLEGGFFFVQGDNALGENGADFSGGTMPANYSETNVTNELSADTDGNGSSDEGVGDNHSGYNGVVDASGMLSSDGAMDVVVEQWTQQEAGQ